jgi:hypothetical protein
MVFGIGKADFQAGKTATKNPRLRRGFAGPER